MGFENTSIPIIFIEQSGNSTQMYFPSHNLKDITFMPTLKLHNVVINQIRSNARSENKRKLEKGESKSEREENRILVQSCAGHVPTMVVLFSSLITLVVYIVYKR